MFSVLFNRQFQETAAKNSHLFFFFLTFFVGWCGYFTKPWMQQQFHQYYYYYYYYYYNRNWPVLYIILISKNKIGETRRKGISLQGKEPSLITGISNVRTFNSSSDCSSSSSRTWAGFFGTCSHSRTTHIFIPTVFFFLRHCSTFYQMQKNCIRKKGRQGRREGGANTRSKKHTTFVWPYIGYPRPLPPTSRHVFNPCGSNRSFFTYILCTQAVIFVICKRIFVTSKIQNIEKHVFFRLY